jgi:hypothetical protein
MIRRTKVKVLYAVLSCIHDYLIKFFNTVSTKILQYYNIYTPIKRRINFYSDVIYLSNNFLIIIVGRRLNLKKVVLCV